MKFRRNDEYFYQKLLRSWKKANNLNGDATQVENHWFKQCQAYAARQHLASFQAWNSLNHR